MTSNTALSTAGNWMHTFSADGRFHPAKVKSVWHGGAVDAMTLEAIHQRNRPVHMWALWLQQELLIAPHLVHVMQELSASWPSQSLVERF